MWRQRSEARIAALEGFEVGDLALFLRSSERPDVYEVCSMSDVYEMRHKSDVCDVCRECDV